MSPSPRIWIQFFNEPDPDDYLYKFLSIWNLADLLHSKALYMARADEWDDNMECLHSEHLKGTHFETMKYPNALSEVGMAANVSFFSELDCEPMQRYHYGSCWFVGPVESASMWMAYAGVNGVAIRLKYKGFKEILENGSIDFHRDQQPLSNDARLIAGQVQYSDYRDVQQTLKALMETEKQTSGVAGFLKHSAYESEREFRVLLRPYVGPEAEDKRYRFEIPVDFLDSIPFMVIINPRGSIHQRKVIEHLLLTYGYSIVPDTEDRSKPYVKVVRSTF